MCSFFAQSQTDERRLLIERSRAHHKIDSAKSVYDNSSVEELQQMLEFQNNIIQIDNKIFENKDGSYKIEKGNILFDENIRRQKELAKKQQKIRYLYGVTFLLLVLLIIAVYLLLQRYKRCKESETALNNTKKRYQADFMELETLRNKLNNLDSSETNLIKELDANIENYRTELEKAGKLIDVLRKDKQALEKNNEKQNIEIERLNDDISILETKIDTLRDKDDAKLTALKKEKQRAEDNFNELHAQSRKLKDERDKLKNELAEAIRLIGKEKEDKETVKKELLGWIEAKKDDFSKLESQQNDKLKQIKTLRFELNTYMAEKMDLQKKLDAANKTIQDAVDKEDNERQTLIDHAEHLNKQLIKLRADFDKIATENSDISYQLEISKRTRRNLEETARLHEEAMNREVEKRKKLETQLANILNNLQT